MCERDADNGIEIARQLVGKVSRKVVKQTVMTLVYGVTFIGGRRQISGQLDDLGLSPGIVWKGSSYLTRNVFASIREMFHAAKDIQVKWQPRYLLQCGPTFIYLLIIHGY